MAEDRGEITTDTGNEKTVPRHAKQAVGLRDRLRDGRTKDSLSRFVRNERTVPKHAKDPKDRSDQRARVRDIGTRDVSIKLAEIPSDPSKNIPDLEEPYKKGEVAEPGYYEIMLDKTQFTKSRLLRYAVPYIESGNFEEATKVTLDGVKNRNIILEEVPEEAMNTITRLDTFAGEERSVMILPDDFDQHRPETKLWELFQRNMELVLRRNGRTLTLYAMKDIYEMGLVYARTLRLGAEKETKDRDMVLASANGIEDWAITRLESIQRD